MRATSSPSSPTTVPAQAGGPSPPASSERSIVFLIGAIQLVNVLDFVMVMPLGPDFAAALGISTSSIGIVGGAYTAAAAVAGLIGSLFLDRFDRRSALAMAMLGLVFGTALGGFATGLGSLLLARVVAGAFGGPATSLSLAIIADAIPPARRGKAMGAVMAAFSVAQVLGVPAGLELARRFGWRAPFFGVAGLGLVVALTCTFLMPSMRGHLAAPRRDAPKVDLLDSVTSVSLLNTALVMLGVFAVVPNLSAYLQHNLHYPRNQLGVLYLVGGAASFVAMRLVGAVTDRVGATPMIVVGTVLHAAALIECFIRPVAWLPVLFTFTLFMVSGSVRMVPMQTLASRVPRPEQRARFMSAQSAVQHTASAAGAMLASLVLVAAPDGKLNGMPLVASAALVVACLVPLVARILERRVRSREAAALQPGLL